MKISPVYRKAHHFLQVGTKHVISTELQIFNCKDGGLWFGDHELNTVVGNLQGELMSRIDRKENDMDVQIIEDESLLMVYKFRQTSGKESIILHRDQIESLGLMSKVPNYGDGDYTYLILFPEKLIISVALIDQSEELLNLTEANLDVDNPGTTYFDNLKKVTMSEKRKKNTLKKIWSTRNRLSMDKKPSPVNEISHDQHVVVVVEDEHEDNPTPQDVVASFKQKISVFENEKSNKNVEIKKAAEKCPKPTTSLEHTSDSNISDQSRPDSNAGLADVNPKGASISRCVKRYPSSGSLRSSSTKKVLTSQCDANTGVVEVPNRLPGQNDKPANTKAIKRVNIKEIEEQFSDNDDFSTIKVKKRTRKNTFYKGTRRKKKKRNTSTSNSEKTDDKVPTTGESLDENNGSQEAQVENLANESEIAKTDKTRDGVTMGTISMEDLIRSKADRESIQPLEEIPTLIAEKTINVDDYGNVSLENIESVNDISLEQVRDLVRDMENDLRKIFKGETKCERHDLFKKGGYEKGSLNMRVAFGLFLERQEEVITNTLIEMFCTRRSKYFDYTMKVLLPETMAMLYAKVEKISYEEADKLILERC